MTARRDGKFTVYQLSDNSVLDLVSTLQKTAERHNAEVGRVIRSYFDDRDSLEAVSRNELMRWLKDGLVTAIDVRPKDECAFGHVPGTINIQGPANQETTATGSGALVLSTWHGC